MAEQIRTVMVLGGTGNLGPHLVSALSNAGFRVSILSRSPRAPSTAASVPIVKSDYSPESLAAAFRGQDAIVCATPATNIADQRIVIDAAVAAGVRRILPNEFGADTEAEGVSDTSAMFRAKAEVALYLREKEKEGLEWTALCTGAWIDWMLVEGQGLLGLDVRARTGTLFDSGEQRFTATTVARVGEAAAAVLLHPNETRNRHVHVSSFLLTPNLVLAALERVSGAKFTVDRSSVAELFADGEERLAEGNLRDGYYKLVTAFLCSGHDAGCFPEKAAYWNGVLGLRQEDSVDQMIGNVLADVAPPEGAN